MQTSYRYVIAEENMFISNILSAWSQVTTQVIAKENMSYVIYSQHVDKSQICYSKRKYAHIKYTFSLQTSQEYAVAKENTFMQTSHKCVIAMENMFISGILSAMSQVTNMLQQKKICAYLIYSQHVDKSQICYSKRKYVHI